MAINLAQLKRLNADYFDQTGIVPKRFVCPITLNDDIHAELINGHILNHGLKTASRATVIQRKDVDGHFGSTIEPDLVKLVNIRLSTPQERIRAGEPREREGWLLLHYVEGDWNSGLLFALTCLFPINNQLYAVCVPSCQSDRDEGMAYRYYQAFLKDRSMRHITYVSRFDEKSFELYREVELNYVTEPYQRPQDAEVSETNL